MAAKRTLVSRGLVVVVALSGPGCALHQHAAANQKTTEEYVWYTPTGSNIPILVKKSAVDASADQTQAAQDALREVQDRGRVEHRKDN